jgi:hypothetical protein
MNLRISAFSPGLARVLLLGLAVTVLACRTPDEPSAPREVRATATDELITVSWTPPEREGRRPITRYLVTASPGGSVATTEGATSTVVRGARRGVAYTFTVRAANEQKEGPGSAPSAPVSLAEPAPPDVVSLSRQSGPRAGCVPIAYAVRQESARRVDVLVEFDAGGTGRFQRATQAVSEIHEGVMGVTSAPSPEGQSHVFLWDAARDLPGVLTEVRLRLTASVAGRAGASRMETITLDNRGLGASRCEVDFVATKNTFVYPAYEGVFEDFDGDGKLDAATLNPYDFVDVFRGLGHGLFQWGMTLTPGPGHSALVAGDFNGDGRLDLASSGAFSRHFPTWYTEPALNVLLGRGDGTFLAPLSMPLEGLLVASMTAGDFNRDGFLDLSTVSKADPVQPQGTKVSLFLGKGDGTFQPPVHVLEDLVDFTRVRAATLDEDWNLDLLVLDSHGGVRVLPGNGDGTFGSASLVVTHSSFFTLGDLDADGTVELVSVRSSAPLVQVLRGKGDGTFQAPGDLALGSPARLAELADLTGDGRPDLLLTASSGDLSVLPGQGDGTFAPARISWHQETPAVVKVVDVDADGRPDVVTLEGGASFGASGLSVLRGRGDGTFEGGFRLQAGTRPVAVVTTDLEGDGALDAVSANEGSHDVSVLLGSGNGTFRTLAPVGVGTKPGALVAADVDGDGRQDLITAHAGGSLNVLRGNGDGTFREPFPLEVGSAPVSLVAADLDADGKPELVTVNRSTNDVRVLRNNGDGAFQAPTAFPVGEAPMALVAGDVDADGKADLVTANRGSGDVSVLRGNGDGTFQAARSQALRSPPEVLVLDDFDRDGKKDLVAGPALDNAVGSVLLFLHGKGDGTFMERSITASETDILHALVAADADGDGVLDLVGARGQGIGSGNPRDPHYSARGNNDVAVWRGNGDGTFRTVRAYVTGQDPHAVSTGDFDGDGRLDLVAANAVSHTLSLLRAR